MGDADGDDPSSKLPALGPYLIACAVASLWIALGTMHRDQHSDSILNVLISLQRWTPFVWEQDRFGMLVPLLARPIREPMANMLAQASLSSFAGLATFFFLARYAARDASYPLIGTVGAASLLALTPPYYRFEYLVDTSYGIGLSLATWGLILVERPGTSRPKWAGAVALLLVAHWVNSVTALFLGPIVALRGLLGSKPDRRALARTPWRSGMTRGLALLAIGYASGQAMIRLSPYQPTTLAAVPASEWPRAWSELLRANGVALGTPLWVGLMGLEATAGAVGLMMRRRRGRSVGLVRSVVTMLATAVVLWLLMGTRYWVKMNDYSFRYLFPSALLAQTAAAALAVGGLGLAVPSSPKRRRAFALGSAVVLLAAGAWSYGPPSIAGVRRDIDARCGTLTDDLMAARCTCLAGDYWEVWLAVFHANLVLHERGEARTFWGLTQRAEPTFALWRGEPRDRCVVAVARDDGQGDVFLRSYLVGKFREVEVRRTIRVLRPIVR